MRTVMLAVLMAALVVGGPARNAFAAAAERLFEAGGTFVGTSENTDDDVATEIERSVGWAKFKLPVPLAGGNALLLGLSWEGQSVDYDKFRGATFQGQRIGEDDLPENLHAIDAMIGLSWRLTETWTTVLQFMPGVHSDFEDISSEDVIFAGSLLFVRPFGDGNRFGLGIAYSDAFGDPQPFPQLLIDYYPAPDWFIEGVLPTSLNAGYRYSDELSFGVEGKLKGYLYRLSEDSPWNDAVLRYREVQFGPFVDYRFYEKAHVRVSAGISAANKFEFHDDDNDDKIVEGDFDNTAYGTVSVYYTF